MLTDLKAPKGRDRNAPCQCGCGKKAKACYTDKLEAERLARIQARKDRQAAWEALTPDERHWQRLQEDRETRRRRHRLDAVYVAAFTFGA
jgi:hypothetical protein